MAKTPITVAYGDGIGPEIMPACLQIMEAAGAQLDIQRIDIGEKVYLEGHTSGIKPEAWESLRATKVLYKAPITTPRGGGYKSLNVTIRKTVGLFANVRPCISFHPFVKTKHPVMDVVIVRENEEDLYAGIEYRQSEEVYTGIKMVTRAGTERIIRYAFDYARFNGRKKVTAFVKDNIMKGTDGLFKNLFVDIAKEYPDITADDFIIDIGTAKLADKPEMFDVIVTQNLYGDIISDVAAEITGSVGLGSSSNIGEHCAMFEAIHGSAPDIAGKGIANPSGLLLAGVLMLNHLGQGDAATKVHNAWLKTIEDGIHTGDIFKPGISKERVGTEGFTKAVLARLGQKPTQMKPVDYSKATKPMETPKVGATVVVKKELVGCDLFIYWPEYAKRDIDAFANKLKTLGGKLQLALITSRGVKAWPDGSPETTFTDTCSCRFKGDGVAMADVLALMNAVTAAGFTINKMETLVTFDGKSGFSAGAGE
ncbi:MAG: NADP-dependent isocitrate dehydrogenase [Bdellovibrionales bacterium]